MLLATLKQGESWDVLAQNFKMSIPAFKKMVTKFANVICDHLYSLFVASVPGNWPMERMKAEEWQFEHFPSVLYAVNVQFQQSNCPSGYHNKSKPYYSGCHHLYGLK